LTIVNIDVECLEKKKVGNQVDKTIKIDQYINLHHQYIDTNLESTTNVTLISNAGNNKTSNYHIPPESSSYIPPTFNMLTSHAESPTPPTVESRLSK